MTRTLALLAAGLLLAGGAHAAQLNDAQIAAIVVAANQVDIDAGKLAQSKTGSADVKAFARQMIGDHTAVNKQAADLAAKLKLEPEENETSRALLADGERIRAKLKTLQGAAFDKAYIDSEVAYHEAVLKTIDDTLLPNAGNAELRQLITQVRPAIDAHLQHARQLQSQLK